MRTKKQERRAKLARERNAHNDAASKATKHLVCPYCRATHLRANGAVDYCELGWALIANRWVWNGRDRNAFGHRQRED